MIKEGRLLPFALVAQCAALTLLPGRGEGGGFLSGIPLKTYPQYAVFLVIALNAVLYLSVLWGRGAAEIFKPLAVVLRRRHVALFALALALKIFLFASNYFYPPESFRYCYSSAGAAETCYFSVDNVFRFKDGATYLSDKLLWNSEGGLEQWYKNDVLYRNRPLTLEVRGFVDATEGGGLRLEYSGAMEISAGGRVFNLNSMIPRWQDLDLSGETGPHLITVKARVTRPLRFKLQSNAAGGWTDARPSASRGGITAAAINVSQAVYFVVYLVFVLALGLNLLAAAGFNARALWAFALAPVMYFASPLISFPALLVIVYILAVYDKDRRSDVRYFQWCIVLFALTAVFVFHHYDAGAVIIRDAGHDPLTYDTFARSVLREASLRAGEDVFYYQPGFRYFMALELLTFGEQNVFPFYVNLSAVVSVLVMFFAWLDRRIGPNALTRASSALFLLIAGRDVVQLVTFNLSEYPSWAMMLAAVVTLYRAADMREGTLRIRPQTITPRAVYAASAMLGVAAVIRPNQSFGLMSILLLWALLVYRIEGFKGGFYFRAAMAGIAIYAAILCLPLVHNLYYGGAFVIFSKSLTQDPTTYVYHPRELLQVFTSEASQRKLWFQISHLLALRKWLVYDMNILKTTIYNLILAAFLASSAYALWRGRRMTVLAGWAVVLCFAGVHIIYQVDNYYPRHIIVIYMMMSAFATVFFGDRGTGDGDDKNKAHSA
jgi:hypothetical protein